MLDFFELIQVSNPYLILVYGLAIGVIHTFESDHISAMTTQLLNQNSVSNKKSVFKKISVNSSLRGMFWGVGHTSSILLIGLIIAGLSISISSDFFTGAEMLVGIMLISLAFMTIFKKNILKFRHIHPHRHGNTVHTHAHTHDGNHRHNHKSYLIGCIHGLAGSGGLVVLATSTLNSFESVLFFIILFGIGSIVGMAAMSGLLGIPFALVSNIKKVAVYFRYAISFATLAIGSFIVYDIVSKISYVELS